MLKHVSKLEFKWYTIPTDPLSEPVLLNNIETQLLFVLNHLRYETPSLPLSRASLFHQDQIMVEQLLNADNITFLLHLTFLSVIERTTKTFLSMFITGTDEDMRKEQEHIDHMMAKLEFLIFHKDHKAGKGVSDTKDKFEDWRERKKKGILYR